MIPYGLRHYISVGGSARREPLKGDEPYLRISMGFHPLWYRQRLGIDFSEKWHLDPITRYRTILKMKRYLHKRFPMIPNFQPRMRGETEKTCATISGVHGVMIMPMIYGIGATYSPDAFPDAVPHCYVPKERLMKMKPLDLTSVPVVRQLWEQMDVIEREWGAIDGYLGWQGVLNIAFRIRGHDIFLDLYDDPEFAYDFFQHIAQTIRDFVKLVQARQRESGFAVNQLSVSNCVMNMVSPDDYVKFLLPHDLMLSREFERFGVHTCEWNITPYIEALRSIRKMGYIDMGSMSDMRRVREVFPEARRTVLFSTTFLKKEPDEICHAIERVARELGPCDIAIGSIDPSVTDVEVISYMRIIGQAQGRELSRQKAG